MNVTLKRSEIELHRKHWEKIAKERNWYKEPFYVQIWVKNNGTIDDSVSMRDIMTNDIFIPNKDNTNIIIDEDN